jgi:hypothetical protein
MPKPLRICDEKQKLRVAQVLEVQRMERRIRFAAEEVYKKGLQLS